jgi:dTDP-glucose pyrophosphorylase
VWGIVPAAGLGSRIQPLAFSKELLPVGSVRDSRGERPRAVSEYLVERMLEGGADKLCFVVAPGKTDILQYYGSEVGGVPVFYAIQPRPCGLCDAIFRALPLVSDDDGALVGLPDTVWFPANGFNALPAAGLSFLLFPVERPELFDAVVADAEGRIETIEVKQLGTRSSWVWGAFRLGPGIIGELHHLWQERGERDEYIGTLVNGWLEQGGSALGVRAGEEYVDVGTLDGYRRALRVLIERAQAAEASAPAWRAGGQR